MKGSGIPEMQRWGQSALFSEVVRVGFTEIQGRAFQAEGKTKAKTVTWVGD